MLPLIVLGTRPEIIKFSPIIRCLQYQKKKFKLVHTGQHYSQSMSASLFKELKLPKPDLTLKLFGRTALTRFGEMVTLLEAYIQRVKPDVVLGL